MKQVFQNHSEVAHIWAQQNQQSGTAGNVSFDGPEIKSFHWWTMAKFVKKDLVLIRNYRYSSYTSKQINHVENALNGLPVKVLYVSDPRVTIGKYGGHKDNIADYIDQMQKSFNTFYKGRDSWNKIQACKDNAAQLDSLIEYCTIFKCKSLLKAHKYSLWKFTITQQFEQTTIDKLINAAESKFNDKIKEYQYLVDSQLYKIEDIEKEWLAGKTNNTSVGFNKTIPWKYRQYIDGLTWGGLTFKQTRVRLSNNGEDIETSRGARVKVASAKLLYKLIQAGKDVKGHRIDNYIVISMNGTLKIGCHDIEHTEVNRLANQLNWS